MQRSVVHPNGHQSREREHAQLLSPHRLDRGREPFPASYTISAAVTQLAVHHHGQDPGSAVCGESHEVVAARGQRRRAHGVGGEGGVGEGVIASHEKCEPAP